MNYNPYEYMGVSANAQDMEIKKVFRTLTDRYRKEMKEGPNRRLAEQKLIETLHAYDTIKKMRADAQASSHRRAESQRHIIENFTSAYGKLVHRGAGNSEGMSPVFCSASDYINSGNCNDALNILNRMESPFRNAEWYHLRALAHSGLGNLSTALEDSKTACGLEPENMKYRRLCQTLDEQIKIRLKRHDRQTARQNQSPSIMSILFGGRVSVAGKIA